MTARTLGAGTALAAAIGMAGPMSGAPGHAAAAAGCEAAVAAQRTRWHAVGQPLIQPPPAPGEALRHWATGTLGVWLVERVAPDETSLLRVAPERLSQVRWSAACAASEDARARTPLPPPAFTDGDLDALLASRRRGALYLWSPHMPLSVDGHAQAVAAAQARGLAVEVVLDPASNREFAAAVRRRAGLPEAALRIVDSVELQFRELALHAPSLAPFDDGRLLGTPLRGYRTADEYAAFLDRVLLRAR